MSHHYSFILVGIIVMMVFYEFMWSIQKSIASNRVVTGYLFLVSATAVPINRGSRN